MSIEKQSEISYHPKFSLGEPICLSILKGRTEDPNGEVVMQVELDTDNKSPHDLLRDIDAAIANAVGEGQIPKAEVKNVMEKYRNLYAKLLQFD